MRVNNFKKIAYLKKNQQNQRVLIGLIKISLMRFQLLLTAANLVTEIKQVHLGLLTFKTQLIKLEII